MKIAITAAWDYGRGGPMLDHLSHAFHTFPVVVRIPGDILGHSPDGRAP